MSILVLLAGAAQATAQPAYPTREVLEGFAEVCRPLGTLQGAAAAAKRVGWQEIALDPNSPAGQLVAFGKAEGANLANEQGVELLPMHTLERTIAGEQLTLVLSGAKANGAVVNGCRVFDIGESREMPAADVAAWLKRAPTDVWDKPELRVTLWEPGYEMNHDSFELYFVPAGSPAIELVKVSGIVLKADFVGATK